ncbi:probable tubulin-tyrosine ligase PBY1 [Trichoderma asperellum]|uniref:Probable tubulin-tyrosine ligase PBY1 n=1 Tax=Trichoderma asperellum TaxID=101201 RepID=A0A6V8QYW8_TRIAP|nr:tubulin-tyrosine ligase family-domain-containing protein [Trichoderma asperelloides]GFP57951.1 probable tubulin-tyrosine ligase PBY1 [Trichoderma asperellum]
MHILVTNDDGPPSYHSPYIHTFVRHLERAGHTVSVCVPDTQRSWIGKAHMIGQTLKPVYYRPSANSHGEDIEGTTHARPSASGDVEEWVLIDGTPASCVQIGTNHFFQHKGPIDLVVSGPNYGRNSTAIFALSSGTLGAALEAAACRDKSIALSFSQTHDAKLIDAACRHSIRVIEYLYKNWPTDGSADLYTINIPLVENIETNPVVWTDILQNYWSKEGCFEAIEPEDEAERIENGTEGAINGASKGLTHKNFKWAPKIMEVHKTIQEGGPGSDGWVVREGHTSVTPLKANFASCAGDKALQEIKLPPIKLLSSTAELPIRESPKEKEKTNPGIQAIVSYDDPYVQPLIVAALNAVLPKESFNLITDISSENFNLSTTLSSSDSNVLQIIPYEAIDFEFASSHTKTSLINSYMIRKALIRKHYLSATLDHWAAKNPDSVLKKHLRRSEAFEVDYAEFLDDALIEAFDLRESLDRNAEKEDASEREWWILKPGMSDRGQGIRLFSTMDELQDIFDGWEAERPDSDDEDEDGDDGAQRGEAEDEDTGGDYITASHLRHFVAQPYIHPPLILSPGGHKFHIRTYVLCTGSLDVYVYKHMLALFAGKPYTAPWEAPTDIEAFLTNTCLQDSPNENTVQRFWNLPLEKTAVLDKMFGQICETTGEVFEAAARAMPIHFQTLPNAFEVFGLDFLVDADGEAWLLEINAFPDFKQTGGDLKEIVEGFWRGVVKFAVGPFFGVDGMAKGDEDEDMVLVRKVDLGRR